MRLWQFFILLAGVYAAPHMSDLLAALLGAFLSVLGLIAVWAER